jgi:hypothetical protein
VFDQSAQLVPGAGGDTAPPLGRCSVIDTKSTSILTVSFNDIDGGSDGGGEEHAVLQVLWKDGDLGPLQVTSTRVKAIADGGKGVRDPVELVGELSLLTVEVVVAIYFCNHCQVVEALGCLHEGVVAPISTGDEDGEPGGGCIRQGGFSIVRTEEEFCDVCGLPRLPPSQ